MSTKEFSALTSVMNRQAVLLILKPFSHFISIIKPTLFGIYNEINAVKIIMDISENRLLENSQQVLQLPIFITPLYL